MEGPAGSEGWQEDRGSGEGAGPGGLGPGGEVTGCPFQGPPGLLAAGGYGCGAEAVLPSSCYQPLVQLLYSEGEAGPPGQKPPGEGGRLRDRGCVFPVLLNTL